MLIPPTKIKKLTWTNRYNKSPFREKNHKISLTPRNLMFTDPVKLQTPFQKAVELPPKVQQRSEPRKSSF